MTLQTLEYFIAVSQHRNFTKAAQACHVSQPALSRAIQSLEEELGCPLLFRAGRVATLTAAGEAVYEEAKAALRHIDALQARVNEIKRKTAPPLRMAVPSIGALNTFVYYLTDPSLPPLETVYGTGEELRTWLLSGEADIILTPECCVDAFPEVEWICVEDGTLHAIVHKENPLYWQSALRMAQLKDQPFIMWKREGFAFIRQAHETACQMAGIMPRVVQEVSKVEDALLQVAVHNGVSFLNPSYYTIGSEEYHLIPVTDAPKHFGVVFAWRRDNTKPQLAAVREVLAKKKKL